MLILNNVDIIAISSDKPIETIKSIRYSTKSVKFGSVKFLTHLTKENINISTDGIDVVNIPEIKSHSQYNDFCLTLKQYTSNDFILIVQNDSFITNPLMWTNDFLLYDYIGAPWTQKQASDWGIYNRVGNGGFSLRSKKFLDFSSNFTSCCGTNEDGFLTNFTSNISNSLGINFAPVSLAKQFAIESLEEDEIFLPENHFGFHGRHLYDISEKFLTK